MCTQLTFSLNLPHIAHFLTRRPITFSNPTPSLSNLSNLSLSYFITFKSKLPIFFKYYFYLLLSFTFLYLFLFFLKTYFRYKEEKLQDVG